MATKVLFVCLGNICRSPSAEGIMNHLLTQTGHSHKIHCDSAGTAAYHVGKPPDRRMAAAAKAQGISLSGKARQAQVEDLKHFDWILAMDQQNYQDLQALDRSGAYQDKIRLMCDFCTQFSDREVPDPYYGGPDGFTYVIDLLQDACRGLLNELIRDVKDA
ncbi:low molecular weight phosphotyrosine protein phosphatase [Synechococcales cyanobacterium C]|uniref:protein-tyrosine-phosphatase n=1 Tax=Petrachloros mirabilis ULC683 TaxID=2781853 RepID=A0A8K2AGU1_9CYAN|nr:low molecular weight protein-tyrosine-phosphatase [Petrachloros mirabilis]NCJ05234.1 low molecular weight phosphotyrosine protein phosphatase [Petrachloros mirabilis ULC683]